jgi:hypothetical protein
MPGQPKRYPLDAPWFSVFRDVKDGRWYYVDTNLRSIGPYESKEECESAFDEYTDQMEKRIYEK